MSQIQRPITLYRGFQTTLNHVWSPYVVKLEMRLRMAGLKYSLGAGNPRAAPKGKIPYVEFESPSSSSAAAPSHMGDSTLIIKAFSEWNMIPDLNAKLTPSERAHDLALRALLEDKMYFYNGKERWIDNYTTMRDSVMWPIPYPIRLIIGFLARRGMQSTLQGQGTGRYTDEERQGFHREVFGAFNDLLGESKTNSRSSQQQEGKEDLFWVLGGEEPTEADCTLFGFIISAVICDAGPWSQKTIREYPFLIEYANKIHERYFADYENPIISKA